MKILLRIRKMILLYSFIFCVKIHLGPDEDTIFKSVIVDCLMTTFASQKKNVHDFIKKQSQESQPIFNDNYLYAYFLYKIEIYNKNNGKVQYNPLLFLDELINALNQYQNISDKARMEVTIFKSIISQVNKNLKNDEVWSSLHSFFNQPTKENAEALFKALGIKEKEQVRVFLSFMDKIKNAFQNVFSEKQERPIKLKYVPWRQTRTITRLDKKLKPGEKIYYKIDQAGNLTEINEQKSNINIIESSIKYDNAKIHNKNINCWHIEINKSDAMSGGRNAISLYIDNQFNKIQELKKKYPDQEFALALTQGQDRLYCSQLGQKIFPIFQPREFSSGNIRFIGLDAISEEREENIQAINFLLNRQEKLKNTVLVILYDHYSKNYSEEKIVEECLMMPIFSEYINKGGNIRMINISDRANSNMYGGKKAYYKEDGFLIDTIMILGKNNCSGATELSILNKAESHEIINLAQEKTIKLFELRYKNDHPNQIGLLKNATKLDDLSSLFSDNIMKELYEGKYNRGLDDFVFDHIMIQKAWEGMCEKVFAFDSDGAVKLSNRDQSDESTQIIEKILQKSSPINIKYIARKYHQKLLKKLNISEEKLEKNDFIMNHLQEIFYESGLSWDNFTLAQDVFNAVYANSMRYYNEHGIAAIINHQAEGWQEDIDKHYEILARKNVGIICDNYLYDYIATQNTPLARDLLMFNGAEIADDYKKKLIDLGILKNSNNNDQRRKKLIYVEQFKEKMKNDNFLHNMLPAISQEIKDFQKRLEDIMRATKENDDGVIFNLIQAADLNPEGSPASASFELEMEEGLERLAESCNNKEFDQKILTRYFSHKDQVTMMIQGDAGLGKTVIGDLIAKLMYYAVCIKYGIKKASSVYILRISGGVKNAYKNGMDKVIDKFIAAATLANERGIQLIFQLDEFTINEAPEEGQSSKNYIPPDLYKRFSNGVAANGHIIQFMANRTASVEGAVTRRMETYTMKEPTIRSVHTSIKRDILNYISPKIKEYFHGETIMKVEGNSITPTNIDRMKNAMSKIQCILGNYENKNIDPKMKEIITVMHSHWFIENYTKISWLSIAQYIQENFTQLKNRKTLTFAGEINDKNYYNGVSFWKKLAVPIVNFLGQVVVKIPGIGEMIEQSCFNPNYIKYAETEKGKELYQEAVNGSYQFFKSVCREESYLNFSSTDNNTLFYGLRLFLSLNKDNFMQAEEKYEINSELFGLMKECETQKVGQNSDGKVTINNLNKCHETCQLQEKLQAVISGFKLFRDCKEADEKFIAMIYAIIDKFKDRMKSYWDDSCHMKFLQEGRLNVNTRESWLTKIVQVSLLDWAIQAKKKEINRLFESCKIDPLFNMLRGFFDDGSIVASLNKYERMYSENNVMDSKDKESFQKFVINFKMHNALRYERYCNRLSAFISQYPHLDFLSELLFELNYNIIDFLFDAGGASRMLDTIIKQIESKNATIDKKDAIQEKEIIKEQLRMFKKEVELHRPVLVLNFATQSIKNTRLGVYLSDRTRWICHRMYGMPEKDALSPQAIKQRMSDKEKILNMYSKQCEYYRSFFNHIKHDENPLKDLYQIYLPFETIPEENDYDVTKKFTPIASKKRIQGIFLLNLIQIGKGRVPNTSEAKILVKKLLKSPLKESKDIEQVVDSLVDKNAKVTLDEIKEINDLDNAYDQKGSLILDNIMKSFQTGIFGELKA